MVGLGTTIREPVTSNIWQRNRTHSLDTSYLSKKELAAALACKGGRRQSNLKVKQTQVYSRLIGPSAGDYLNFSGHTIKRKLLT